MIDLHTHILPAMDDGAADVEMGLAMLRVQREQGVTGLVLTPHFYRDEERPDRFFARRRESWNRLLDKLDETGERFPSLALGAEVSWVPGMSRWEDLRRYCMGYSRYFLLELPDSPWRSVMLDEIYEMAGSGEIIPVIAHLDRYLGSQKADHLEQLMRMGIPLQISAEPMLHTMERFRLSRRIKGNSNCLLISDCHDITNRPPNLVGGMAGVEKSLGGAYAAQMQNNSRRIFRQAIEKEKANAPK